jgi:predicted nucleic acid-binding protein
MSALVDTNVLPRLAQPNHPHAAAAERALNLLHSQGEGLYVASQNLIEFWVVATRPESENGLGLSTAKAFTEVSKIKEIFGLLPEIPLHDFWERIVTQYRVAGKTAHDSRLVAAMQANGIAKIVTFNSKDFSRYEGVEAVDPREIA